MKKTHAPTHHHLALFVLAVIGLLIFLASLGVTIWIAPLLSPPQKAPMTLKTLTKSTTPTQLIDTYQKAEEVSLAQQGYSQQTKTFLNPSITDTSSSTGYTIHVSPAATTLYERSDAAQKTNDTKVLNDLDMFMQQEGLSKTTTTAMPGAATVTYDNPSSAMTCQSLQLGGSAKRGASFSLSCVTHDALKAEQTAIASLLTIYKQSHPAPAIIDITRVHAEEGTKHLDRLIINARNTTPPSFSLYFAGLTANSTSYIGSQATVSIDTPQTPAPSADLVAALKDTSYGDFLTKNIVLNGTTKTQS